MDFSDHPHRRYNPLSGEWVLVSPQRTKRPWQGKQEFLPDLHRPAYEPTCYLCPRNSRAGGHKNPDYTGTYVFTNDFAALLPDSPAASTAPHPLVRSEGVQGTSRVVCFSPRHDLTLPELAIPEIRQVIDSWARESGELGKIYRWVQIFENKGETMGCSNPHPHGQIWASSSLPAEPAKEHRHQREYVAQTGTLLLPDYLRYESESSERIVLENPHWVSLVPFWAVWPFEVLLLPRRHVLRLPDLTEEERVSLADMLKRLLTRLDNLFQTPFPYTFGWHGAPYLESAVDFWQLHAHLLPPLLRSATVRKFMVGYEMLAEPQRDITPEQAAARIRNMSEARFPL
jgi:UDPglucose--hexose-1-phosphate uridylyltransferase